MKYLLDTCVLSEIIKPLPDNKVIKWLRNIDEEKMYVSVLTFGELEKGIEKALNLSRKKKLQIWVRQDLSERFENRVINIDLKVAARWGEVQGRSEKDGNPMSVIDGLIAVSGLVHDCIVVTRNISDMKQSGVELFNPWSYT
jgi:predicted nucleic acid-binding protein